jgi:hypothetical protein
MLFWAFGNAKIGLMLPMAPCGSFTQSFPSEEFGPKEAKTLWQMSIKMFEVVIYTAFPGFEPAHHA